MIDNSDLQQKLNVRKKGLVLLPNPSLIVDMYAGEGHISRALWSKFNARLICIEKEWEKVSKIDFPSEIICDDNRKHIELAAKADIVDLDAYGLVMKNVQDVLNANDKTQLLFFTEANPFSKFISKTVEEIIKLDITSFWIEKSKQSHVYYGYIYRAKL